MQKFLKKTCYLLEYFIAVIIIKLLTILGINRAASICSYIARKIGPKLAVHKIAKKNMENVLIYESSLRGTVATKQSRKSPQEADKETGLPRLLTWSCNDEMGNTPGSFINYDQLLEQTWDNFGRFIGEFPFVSKLTEEELSKRVEIIGLENIHKFQESNQPFLLFTGHFANWDFALRVLDKFYPKFSVVYRKANNPYIDALINKARAKHNVHLIPKGHTGASKLRSAIKSGHSIGMLVDQKMNDGIKVPFLGRPAMTPVAIAKIALQFNYPIVPCQVIRKSGSYFKIIIHPALNIHSTTKTEANYYDVMLKINQILGDWIKQHPGQWFWFHNRWGKQ